MTYPEILSRIEATTGHAPQKSGEGHVARCPAHDDRTPSLTLAVGDDGRTLAHCQRGCAFDAVASALGLKPADFYAGDPEPPAWNPKRDGSVKTATYDYTDAEGALLFQKLRREPKPGHPARGRDKTFTQRRRDPDNPRRWIYSLGDCPRPPYRLPEVRAAVDDGRLVFVVEGEKDADCLAALGFVATTNDGGAGKWKAQHTAALVGAPVVVMPDHDVKGRAHARDVCDALDGIAESVVVVALTTLPSGEPAPVKFDVSDWLEAGGTAEALKALVREAPSAAEAKAMLETDAGTAPFASDKAAPDAEADDDKGKRRTVSSVLDIRSGAAWMEAASQLAEPRPLWGPLWFEGETTILFSESNAGKSVQAVQIAQAIASGQSLPGFPTAAEPQPVLYLDFEQSAKQWERRYSRDFTDPFRFSPGFHRAEVDPDVLADEDAFDVAIREAIEAAVAERGYRVVIVDNPHVLVSPVAGGEGTRCP